MNDFEAIWNFTKTLKLAGLKYVATSCNESDVSKNWIVLQQGPKPKRFVVSIQLNETMHPREAKRIRRNMARKGHRGRRSSTQVYVQVSWLTSNLIAQGKQNGSNG